MKSEVTTVDYLLSLFNELSEQGKGDMKIKCTDNYLHEDEIGVDYLKNEVLFRGSLFNVPITDKVKRFCNDIEKAKDRFYGNRSVITSEQPTEHSQSESHRASQ